MLRSTAVLTGGGVDLIERDIYIYRKREKERKRERETERERKREKEGTKC